MIIHWVQRAWAADLSSEVAWIQDINWRHFCAEQIDFGIDYKTSFQANKTEKLWTFNLTL